MTQQRDALAAAQAEAQEAQTTALKAQSDAQSKLRAEQERIAALEQSNKELETRAAEAEATANEQAKQLAEVTTALDVANVAITKADEEAASFAMQRNIAAGLFVIALVFALMSRRGTA